MSIEKPKCFVIMPFGKAPKAKWDSRTVYERIIKPAVKKAFGNYDLEFRIDKQYVKRTLTSAIEEKLKTADIVIADLSGNNPNVTFELGFRYAQEKPFVCISSNPTSAGFWPRTFKITDYTSDDAIGLIKQDIQEAYRLIRNRLKTEEKLEELVKGIRKEGEFENPFQDRVSAWRVRRAWEQVEVIEQGVWEFEAKTPTAYIAYMFEGIMDILAHGEEYCTVTNLDFWSERAVGESPFLKANEQAIHRGVTVKRVFLIDRKKWNRPSSRDKLKAMLMEHKRACDRGEKAGRGKMIVKCLLSDNFSKDLSRYGHFGLARHTIDDSADEGSLLIVPGYARDKTISSLQVLFSGGNLADDRMILDYENKFEKAFEAARELHAFLRRR